MNAREEHLATRRAAGLFDFSFMGLYEFHEKSSIQRLQTRDLSALEPGRVAYTLLLNPDGSVFNDATVWNMGAERWWLFTGRPGDIAWLGTAARNRSGEHAILALQGPASGRILARLISSEPVQALKYFHFLQIDNLIAARLGFSGELGYELMVPAAEASALREKLLNIGGLRECSWAAADSLRIESGYVLFDREIDGRANPRELGLDRLAPGRKFEATRKLVGLEVLDGQVPVNLPATEVTSECFSPTLGKTLALGFVSPEIGAGSAVRLPGRIARVATLPFYDPKRRRPRGAPLE